MHLLFSFSLSSLVLGTANQMLRGILHPGRGGGHHAAIEGPAEQEEEEDSTFEHED